MSDENEYSIETADAGASDTIPCEAGQIKKGGWVMYWIDFLYSIVVRFTKERPAWKAAIPLQLVMSARYGFVSPVSAADLVGTN